MLALEEWGSDKPPMLAMFAQYVAVSSDLCYEMCLRSRKGGKHKGNVYQISPRDWAYLSMRRRGTMAALAGMYDGGEEDGYSLADIIECRAEVLQMQDHRGVLYELLKGMSRSEFVNWLNAGIAERREAYQRHLIDLRRLVAGGIPHLSQVRRLLESREVLFFVRVIFPCWLEYGTPFLRLLRNARQGNLDALEKLLRLDKMAMEDGRVREHYFSAVESGNAARRKRLNLALDNGPCHRFSKQKIKVSLGALVLKLFQSSYEYHKQIQELLRKGGIVLRGKPYRLKAPEVRKLFDAAAKDLKKEEVDSDLSGGPHTFYMALRRAGDFWRITF